MTTPLVNIYHVYLQVDFSTSPYEILGLHQNNSPDASEIKAAYKSLALRLHPDKAPSDSLLATHHRLFLKLRQAHDQLLNGNSGAPEAPVVSEYKAILEGPLSLHQRNLDFKAKLRDQRRAAVSAKHELETRAARNAQIIAAKAAKAKHFAAKKKAREAAAADKRTEKAAKRASAKGTDPRNKTSNHATQKANKRMKKAQTKDRRAKIKAEVNQMDIAVQDDILAPPEDIIHRRHKELLSGAPRCVSDAEQKRRDNSIMALELKVELWIQSQEEKRFETERAKLFAQGVFFNTDSIDEENLWTKVQADLREEAAEYYGINTAEFMAVHY